MNGNDERNIDAVDANRIVLGHRTQGNNGVSVLNSSHSTVKIDSLSIKLGIVKEKGDAPKCRHFSIRGYAAGMREKGSSNVLPFIEELPPMDIPNFRYWLCQRCLQNNGTEDDSKETKLVSVCEQCLFRPSNEETDLPFGEGTSGVKPVDNKNNDDSIIAALGGDESQTLQAIPEKVKLSQEIPKFCSVDTSVVSRGTNENKELRDQEDSANVRLLSQPIESGQRDDCQNAHPRRKARKVRLLKELLCVNKNVESPEQKNENSSPLVDSNKIKRKLLHDRDRDHDHECVYDHRFVDSKKAKPFKGNTITKNVVEISRNPEAREGGETSNVQRNSILGSVGSDVMTAWRTIFSDMGRTENQVPPSYGVSKGIGTEAYSNFMAPPKSNKKVNFSKKIPSNSLKNKYLGEDTRRMKDRQSDRELGLGLSLNYDPQSQIRSPPFIPNRTPTQDHRRKSSIYFREYDIHDVSNRHPPKTQFPYSSCSGHQKLAYSDITRPRNHQRQEKTFSIGRSDEREIIELLAKNQYERNLSEARSHFAANGIIPNTSGITSSSNHGYHNMLWPSSESVGLTPMRNSDGGYFHQDKVSSFTMFDSLTESQRKPSTNGIWISDSGPQRHYESRYDHNVYNNPTNMQVLDGYNKYNSAAQQNEASGQRFGQPFGQPYSKYSEKDKGKNMIDLDLNVVAPNVVDEQNNLESLRSLDSSYSNETIPAMQLLSLMDAGKSSQPFNINSQKFSTKTLSPCYSNCSSTVTEKTNSMVNSHFPYSGLRPSVQNPIPSSFSTVFQNGQNVQWTSTQSQQVYHKPQEEKSKGSSLISGNHRFRQEDSYVFPFPWHATEDRNKLVNDGATGNRFNSPRTEICIINRNPADFTTPGPENEFMINAEDLRFF